MGKTSRLIAALLCCWGLAAPRAMATDYVDDINNGQHADGQHVVYEMNVGAFTAEGTLAAAQARLKELKRIGADIVWLMPIYPRGGGINSPYAATDFQQVNPAYGTIDDLKAFVGAAHALGMQVWLDWVPNHTATDARWVGEHPEYYKRSGGSFVHPNNYADVYQLDYGNGELRKAMTDCMKFWIDRADVDGYRCDYISSREIPVSYWQEAIPEIKGCKAGKNITFLGEADIAADATRLKAAGFDYDYAWQFQSQLANFGNGTAAARPRAFANTLMAHQDGIGFGRMLYITNHDQNYNEKKKTLAQKYGDNRYPLTVLYFTVWGMPLVYNGQETGGNQALNYFTDEKNRLGANRQQDAQHHTHAVGPETLGGCLPRRQGRRRQPQRQLAHGEQQHIGAGLQLQAWRQRGRGGAQLRHIGHRRNRIRAHRRRIRAVARQRDHRPGHGPQSRQPRRHPHV